MDSISIVIPHKGRDNLLIKQLYALAQQTHGMFDVVIVLDEEVATDVVYWTIGNHSGLYRCLDNINLPVDVVFSGGGGPATARNVGVQHAKGDIILFLGSDCLPDKNLVAEHHRTHGFSKVDIVQGYTPWHPDVVTPFYDFLETSGLQAAWSNLRTEDGAWKTSIDPIFFLTTNISARRQVLLNEPFDESFTGAAWEDVELGYRLSRRGDVVSVFNPLAINYHYHRYDLESFLRRCRMEGYHRLTLCKKHPELAWNLVNPFELRLARDIDDVASIIKWTRELDGVDITADDDQTVALKQIKYDRYLHACKVFSLLGVFDRIADEHPAMQALHHVHAPEQVIQITSGVRALENGHIGYAQHCAQWFINDVSGDWSAHAFAGEVSISAGDVESAIGFFRKSIALNSNEEWPQKRLAELI